MAGEKMSSIDELREEVRELLKCKNGEVEEQMLKHAQINFEENGDPDTLAGKMVVDVFHQMRECINPEHGFEETVKLLTACIPAARRAHMVAKSNEDSAAMVLAASIALFVNNCLLDIRNELLKDLTNGGKGA